MKNYKVILDYVCKNNCELISSENEILNADYSKTKLKFKCSCGKEFEKSYNNFKRAPLCKECSKDKIRTSFEDIESFVNKNGNGTKLISTNYTNSNDLMIFECACGEQFETSFHYFKSEKKRQCDKCGLKSRSEKASFDIEDVKSYIKDNNYSCEYVSGKYDNLYSPLIFRCKCGEHFETNFSCLKATYGQCKKCRYEQTAKNNLMSNETYVSKVKELWGDEYEPLEEYKGYKAPIKIKHNKCGKIYTTEARNLIRGSGCPYCSCSKGEDAISKILDGFCIKYITQYKFADCKYIRELPFDFFLNELNICIEFQGIQHYEAINHFGGEQKFKQQQKMDNIKRKYCKNNNIKLLEICYKDIYNIENIIQQYINNHANTERGCIATPCNA